MASKGLGLLALLGAGVGLLVIGGSASATPIDDSCFDANMPTDLKNQVKAALAKKDMLPKDLELLADTTDKSGYPKAAACLRQQAKNRENEKAALVAEKGGLPHTIRYGDIPYLMAKYYTGNATRFRELEGPNPHIGKLQTTEYPPGSGTMVSNYPGWAPGVEIVIPAAWNPLDKPKPPVASGGGAAAGGTPPIPGGVEIPNPEKILNPENPNPYGSAASGAQNAVRDVLSKFGF